MPDAGTVTLAERKHTITKKLTFTWSASNPGGAADKTSVEVYDGAIIAAQFVPDGGGTQPSDNYDVTVVDAAGVDVLFGAGANRSNAAAQVVTSGLGVVAGDPLTLHVTNAGNGKGGSVSLYIR